MPTLKDDIFRELALRKGAISEALLDQAADTQAEMERFGIPKFLGGILVEKNLVEKEIVAETVGDMEKYSVQCPHCQHATAVTECDRKGNLKCRSCREPVRYPPGRISEEDLNTVKGARKGKKARAAEKGSTDSPLSGPATPPKSPRSKKGFVSKGAAPLDVIPEGKKPRQESRRPVKHEKVFLNEYTDPPACLPDFDRFSAQHLLGVSAVGKLYRISRSGEFGALKILDRALCADKAQFKKWMDFMQRVQDLPRSATLKPTQFLREESVNYMVRPYVSGENATLRERLESGSPLSNQAITDLAIALLNSLSAFHSIKLIHGNLKPENVILSESAVQLSDPGVHLLLAGLTDDERIVRMWDSHRYHAPEVLQGGLPTPESDLFSVGHILEDVLESRGGEASPDGGKAGGGFSRRLQRVVKRMGAFDPADRYASAREVLRDLQKKDTSAEVPADEDEPDLGPDEQATPTPGARAGSGIRRLLQPQMVGPLVLSLVLSALFFQGLSWFRVRSALASTDRDENVAGRMVSRELDALVEWTKTSGADYEAASERWNNMASLLRGTSWDAEVSRKSRQALSHVPRPERQRVRQALERVRDDTERSRWIPALEGILAIEGEDEPEELADLRRRIQEGLCDELGMVFIPRGEVEVTKGRGKYPEQVGPFLVDAGLVSRNSPDGEPLVGIELENARRLADSVGKRLPTGAEWDLMAAAPDANGSWQEFAATKLRDVRGPVFQWVEPDATDRHSRDYGVCRGGDRPGIPETHPVRRRLKIGHPDVGVRFVKDVESGSLDES